MKYKFHFIDRIKHYEVNDIRHWLWRADDPQLLTEKILKAEDLDHLTFEIDEAIAIANGAVEVEKKLFLDRRLNIMDSNLSYYQLENMGYLTDKDFKQKNNITLKTIDNLLLDKIEYVEWRRTFPRR